jgi:hypothetical protein
LVSVETCLPKMFKNFSAGLCSLLAITLHGFDGPERPMAPKASRLSPSEPVSALEHDREQSC